MSLFWSVSLHRHVVYSVFFWHQRIVVVNCMLVVSKKTETSSEIFSEQTKYAFVLECLTTQSYVI